MSTFNTYFKPFVPITNCNGSKTERAKETQTTHTQKNPLAFITLQLTAGLHNRCGLKKKKAYCTNSILQKNILYV